MGLTLVIDGVDVSVYDPEQKTVKVCFQEVRDPGDIPVPPIACFVNGEQLPLELLTSGVEYDTLVFVATKPISRYQPLWEMPNPPIDLRWTVQSLKTTVGVTRKTFRSARNYLEEAYLNWLYK